MIARAAAACLAAIVMCAAAPIVAQKPTDFSGTWKLDRGTSQITSGTGIAGLGAGGAPNTLYISQALNGTVVIGSDVKLGDEVELVSHVVVAGRTSIGSGCRVFPFASIGHRPQDLKYAGEPSTLEIGQNTTIREHVTINPGTAGGGMLTKIGDNCWIMIGVHIGHDCIIGNNVVFSNNVTFAGHCRVDDYVVKPFRPDEFVARVRRLAES